MNTTYPDTVTAQKASTQATGCRLCGNPVLLSVLDLGATPPCEKFLSVEELDAAEPTYPLHLRLCEKCLLLQIPALITPEDTFVEYAYFSSFSTSWVDHAKKFVDSAADALALDENSFVVEVASNDGYLLQHAVARNIPCLGIEPSVNVGQAAIDRGVPTLSAFLTEDTATQVRQAHGPADLVVANNVYAHIPDLLGFTKALRILLSDNGRLSIEVHHALELVTHAQFDTIYHEHFQYYTVLAARNALATAGLELVDVERLETHGGSIRLWATTSQAGVAPTAAVENIIALEQAAGLHETSGYLDLQSRSEVVRQNLLEFLLESKRNGLSVVGYGAPGKGNTLLNYCGIRPDLLAYTVDRNPYKHGKFTPGTRIPIHHPDKIAEDRPDVVLVLPWNLETEITAQLDYVHEWGGRIVYPLPTVHSSTATEEN